jgi:hypothetical protein
MDETLISQWQLVYINLAWLAITPNALLFSQLIVVTSMKAISAGVSVQKQSPLTQYKVFCKCIFHLGMFRMSRAKKITWDLANILLGKKEEKQPNFLNVDILVLLHNGGSGNACTIKRSITLLCIPQQIM